MGKSTIIKIGAIILGVAAIGTTVVVGYQHYNKFIASNNNNQEEKQKEEEEKKIEESISNDDSEKAKQELKDFEDKKENSQDIIIPDDVTEEKKEQLEAKKTYLQIFEKVSELYNSSTDNENSTMTGINKIFKSKDGYVLYVSSVNQIRSKFYKSNSFIQIGIDNVADFEEFNLKLKEINNAQELYVFNDYSKSEEINKEIFRLTTLGFSSNQYELLNCTSDKKLDSNEAPLNSCLFIKINEDSGNIYELGEINYARFTWGKTYDEAVEIFRNREDYLSLQKINYTFEDSNLDWEKYKNQNESVNSAEIIVENFSTKDENGKVSGMNWNIVQEQRQQAQAKKEAKLASQDAAMDHTPLYSDQELSL